jgi:hypothetical protein
LHFKNPTGASLNSCLDTLARADACAAFSASQGAVQKALIINQKIKGAKRGTFLTDKKSPSNLRLACLEVW